MTQQDAPLLEQYDRHSKRQHLGAQLTTAGFLLLFREGLPWLHPTAHESTAQSSLMIAAQGTHGAHQRYQVVQAQEQRTDCSRRPLMSGTSCAKDCSIQVDRCALPPRAYQLYVHGCIWDFAAA